MRKIKTVLFLAFIMNFCQLSTVGMCSNFKWFEDHPYYTQCEIGVIYTVYIISDFRFDVESEQVFNTEEKTGTGWWPQSAFELYKEDKLWNKLNLPNLKFKEDYNELEDTYNFHKENSYVFTVLDSAHDILLIANSINKNKRK